MSEPVILELAALPREQIGPFLLLGLDKGADTEAVEAHWAERLKWARRQLLSIPLEDINWAREVLRDPERRLRADIASLNVDLQDGQLAQMAARFGPAGGTTAPRWQPLDREPDLSQYELPTDVPDAEAVRAALVVPDMPDEYPAALRLLREFVTQPLDPWALDLPAELPAGPRPETPLS